MQDTLNGLSFSQVILQYIILSRKFVDRGAKLPTLKFRTDRRVGIIRRLEISYKPNKREGWNII